jgi:methyl-accepting chemotaxis protein
MASTNEDLALRIQRLEHDLRRLATAAAGERQGDPVNRLTFLGWLKLSGSTFAVMVFGFGLLWQAQQVNTAQIAELSRSTNTQIAELSRSTNAQIAELARSTNAQIAELSRSMNDQFIELGRTVGRLEGAIAGLQAQIAQLGTAIDKLSERVDRLEIR